MPENSLTRLLENGAAQLAAQDPALFALLEQETERQKQELMLVASSSIADPAVLFCEGMATTNVSTEGYPGRRYHAGCDVVDEIERLAVARAKAAFGAQYANVQPHSGTTANQVVMFSLLAPGASILGLDLQAGGHLSHGAKASVSGNYFDALAYGVNSDGFIDYQEVAALARRHRPAMIICGGSAYPRQLDFARFRAIADEVGAWLLADISHIAGLIVAGEHPSPIDEAHITTTSTYKQLFGPRGGLILSGQDSDRPVPGTKRTLQQQLQRALFPYFQGTPNLSAIAAKARAFAFIQEPGFLALARLIRQHAATLAAELSARGYQVVTGGTDNHMVLFDVLSQGVTGYVAEKALQACGLIVNKNGIPGDQLPPTVTSGIRLGSNSLARRGFSSEDVQLVAGLMDKVIRGVQPKDQRAFTLAAELEATVRSQVVELCGRYPIPRYD